MSQNNNTGVQETSKQAYHSLEDLSKRQRTVYENMKIIGSCTNLELSKFTGIPINQITPRTYELRHLGFVAEMEKRTCKVSGRNAIAWKVIK